MLVLSVEDYHENFFGLEELSVIKESHCLKEEVMDMSGLRKPFIHCRFRVIFESYTPFVQQTNEVQVVLTHILLLKVLENHLLFLLVGK